jgi:hypothetical protein
VRVILILFQCVGVIGLIPWPAVVVASVMSLAAERSPGAPRFPRITIFFLVAPCYPVIWILAYKAAWRAMLAGLTNRAFLLSAIPVFLSILAVVIWKWTDRPSSPK